MASVFLLPTILADGQTACLPSYILDGVKQCHVFFVENERTARRFLKSMWREMVIDDYEWYTIKDINQAIISSFVQKIKENKTIGIISEAGCPGVADPGQKLIAVAQEMNVPIKPFVGPSSILLALMASGMNGQNFRFLGYLPIDMAERANSIKAVEADSMHKDCTQIFIETPYRNNQLMETLLKTCAPKTKICVAADLTADTEFIKTKTVQQWKNNIPQLHKRPTIFLLYAGLTV